MVTKNQLEKAVEIVSETCWEGDIEEASRQRLLLYEVAGLDPEMYIKARSGVPKRVIEQKQDENSSYSALVESTGF